MTAYAVIVRGAAVAPGSVNPGHIVPATPAEPVPVPEERACGGTTKAGDPCKGRAGDDGFCAAHKPAED